MIMTSASTELTRQLVKPMFCKGIRVQFATYLIKPIKRSFRRKEK